MFKIILQFKLLLTQFQQIYPYISFIKILITISYFLTLLLKHLMYDLDNQAQQPTTITGIKIPLTHNHRNYYKQKSRIE